MKCPTNANGTVTKIGTSSVGTDLKPIKLVNGVPTAVSNDFVDTTSTQNISGEKTFTKRVTFDYYNPVLKLDTGNSIGMNIRFNTDTYNVAPSGDISYVHTVYDKNNAMEGRLQFTHGDTGSKLWRLMLVKNDGTETKTEMKTLSDGTTYVVCPNRTYNASNTSDVVTIGTLQSSTDVVHTSGNESVSGNKSFLSTLYIGSNSQYSARIDAYGETGSGNRKLNIIGVGDTFGVRPSNYRQYSFFSWSDENNRLVAGLRAIHHSDGTYSVQIMTLNSDGTEKYATLIKGDVIT